MVVTLGAFGAWWVDRQLEPHRLTDTVLGRLGSALQLSLSYSGDPEYALKPEPRLVLPKLVARDAHDGKLLLTASRLEISLPWSTLTGGDPVITRLELSNPELDLSALRRWQARRPEKPFRLPTLNKGLQISNGIIRIDDWAISQIQAQLPHLRAGAPARLTLTGRFQQGRTKIDFHTTIATPTPGLASDYSLIGSGRLAQATAKPLLFKTRLSGRYDYRKPRFALHADTFRFTGGSPLPDFNGAGQLTLTDTTHLVLSGRLLSWPKAWPALPEPLAANKTPLQVQLDYAGKSDFSEKIALTLSQDAARLATTLRIEEMQRWVAQGEGSPVPPLQATLTAPRLQFDGVVLEGVEVEIQSDTSPSAPESVEP